MTVSLSEYIRNKKIKEELRMKNISLSLEIINQLKFIKKNGLTTEMKLTSQQRIVFYENDLQFFIDLKL